MKYVHYNSEQYFFDRVLYGVWTAIRFAGKAIVYFPQLLTGYCVTQCFLNRDENGATWIALTVLFAFLFYQFIFLLKGILIGFKKRKRFWWLPLFILCVSYTCMLPVMLFIGLLHNAVFYFNTEHTDVLTWLFAIVIGGYLYSRYEFLSDNAPKIALSIYKFGVSISAGV